jgi:hypothetical protein
MVSEKPKQSKLNQQKRRAKKKKAYSFQVSCSFTLQFTFPESDVERDPGGDSRDFHPTDEALRRLAEELAQINEDRYPVNDFHPSAESENLLGVHDE